MASSLSEENVAAVKTKPKRSAIPSFIMDKEDIFSSSGAASSYAESVAANTRSKTLKPVITIVESTPEASTQGSSL